MPRPKPNSEGAIHRQLLTRLNHEPDAELARLKRLYRGDRVTRQAVEAEQQWRLMQLKTR